MFGDLGTKIKKGLQFVYGSADLDPARDPMNNLDREEEGKPAPGKDWDRG